MKKVFGIFLTIITLSSAMFLGGCSMPSSRSEKEEMIQIAQVLNAKYEQYFILPNGERVQ